MTQRFRAKRSRSPAAAPDAGSERGWRGAVLCLTVPAVVAGLALWQAGRAWQALPVSQIRRLDPRQSRQLLERARFHMTGDVRSGWIMNIVSAHLVTLLREPSSWARLWEDAVGGAAQVRASHLPQLQLAALRLAQPSRSDDMVALGWPQVSHLLHGVDPAALRHFLLPLTAYYSDRYRELGLTPGTALRMAESAIGLAHGVFLQILVRDLARLSTGVRESQPDAAAQLDRLRRRLLREWVLQPGPAELRLLAAELLAEERDGAGRAGESGALALADDLRAWRSAYRAGALAAAASSPVLGWPERPVVDSWAREQLPSTLVRMVNLAAFMLTALVVELVAGWWVPGLALRRNRGLFVRLLLVGAVLPALAALPADLVPGIARDDVRRLTATDLGWPRLPLVAALGGLLVPVLIGCAVPRALGGRRWTAVAMLAAAVVVVAGIGLIGTSLGVRSGLARYEHELAGHGADNFAAVAGAEADALLNRLRAWNPP